MWTRSTLAAFIMLCCAVPFAATGAEKRTELVMFELGTCIYCAVWNDAVGSSYASTSAGARAPLRRVDLREPRPDDLQDVNGVRMTPTFVLMHDGAEIGRIHGYIDAETFWRQMQTLLWKIPH